MSVTLRYAEELVRRQSGIGLFKTHDLHNNSMWASRLSTFEMNTDVEETQRHRLVQAKTHQILPCCPHVFSRVLIIPLPHIIWNQGWVHLVVQRINNPCGTRNLRAFERLHELVFIIFFNMWKLLLGRLLVINLDLLRDLHHLDGAVWGLPLLHYIAARHTHRPQHCSNPPSLPNLTFIAIVL